MTPRDYVALIGPRLRADGAAVTAEQLSCGAALVGHRSRFRLRWMATKLHVFTVAISAPIATGDLLDRFSTEALDFAVHEKGKYKGLQTGVAAVPVLVAETVEPEAAEWARSTLVRRFAAFAWPTVVDLSEGLIHEHEGSVAVGGIYASYMRERIAAALPDPRGQEDAADSH